MTTTGTDTTGQGPSVGPSGQGPADAPLPAPDATGSKRMLLVPHLGLGDALVLRGAVGALAASCDRLVVVGLRRYRASLEALYSDLASEGLALALVDSATDISPAFGSDGAAIDAFVRDGHLPVLLGDHSPPPAPGAADWRAADPLWTRALYMHLGLDPALMRSGFSLPRTREARAAAMLARVREITGGAPYALVHDDPDRPLLFPELPEGTVCLHVDDARFRSDCLFDYVEVVRHAARLHAIDSCFALLADLAGLARDDSAPGPSAGPAPSARPGPGPRVTVHAYAKPGAGPSVYSSAVEVLDAPPTRGLYGAHLVPRLDGVCDALLRHFRHFAALQDIMGPSRAEWQPCGSYLMGPASLDYDPSMLPKQALLFDRARGARSALEVGVHGGHSLLLLLLAEPGCRVTCVDVCGWSHTARCVRYLRDQFPGRVVLLEGDSRDVLPVVHAEFDLVHVDGDHSLEGAKADMLQAARLAHPGTTFVFDDYCDGIARAVDELAHTFEVVEVPSCPWRNCVARLRPSPSS